MKEIPFGTKDSELKYFEYIIPEGYEAEIKDGKVIFEKTEDDDEKIRKALIKLVTNHVSMDLFIAYDINVYKALAWLEKQKYVETDLIDADKQFKEILKDKVSFETMKMLLENWWRHIQSIFKNNLKEK